MYLRLDFRPPLIDLAKTLRPELARTSYGYDYENVYEWLFLEVPPFPALLNVSRDHGQAEELEQDQQPGFTYLCTDDRQLDIPNEHWRRLAREVADLTRCRVELFAGRHFVEVPEGTPIDSILPQDEDGLSGSP